VKTNTSYKIESFEAEQSHFDNDFIKHASNLFMLKGGMTREEFNVLDEAMRVRAFTVAYVESVDSVLAIQNILNRAILEGTTLSQFRTDVAGYINSNPWHVETVFRTNVQTAYGAARWERAQRLRSLRPYARYSAIMDGRTRPTHAALHGLVYPIDHPFWQKYWPPWDYNCFVKETIISTPYGNKPIGEIKKGDLVFGGSGIPQLVTAVHQNFIDGELTVIRCSGSGSVAVTPNHRILTKQGWKQAGSLTSGDMIIKPNKGFFGIDSAIRNIDHVDALLSDELISFKAWKSKISNSKALNSDLFFREIDINPEFSDTMVKNNLISKRLEVLHDFCFSDSGGSLGVGMLFGIAPVEGFSELGFPLAKFFGLFSSSEFFGSQSDTRMSLFGFPVSPVNSFSSKFIHRFSHFLRSGHTPFRIVDPLSLNSFGSLPDSDIIFSEYFDQSPTGNTKQFGNPAYRDQLFDIEVFKDGTGRSFAESLDLGDNFFRWYALHRDSFNEVLIVDVNNINYKGPVVNLSVENDESYLVDGLGIAHNCRCHAVTFTQMELEAENLTPSVAMPNVPLPRDFRSPAAGGITINPAELVFKRTSKMQADGSIAVHNKVNNEIQKIKDQYDHKPKEITW